MPRRNGLTYLRDSTLGVLVLLGEEAGKQAEQANPKMDEVEVEIEIEPDGAEITQPQKASGGEERVDCSKDETKEACAA